MLLEVKVKLVLSLVLEVLRMMSSEQGLLQGRIVRYAGGEDVALLLYGPESSSAALRVLRRRHHSFKYAWGKSGLLVQAIVRVKRVPSRSGRG